MINMGCVTDRGKYRSKNQDRIMCRWEQKEDTVLAVACVCDGIGSFKMSEIASEMLISGISAWFEGIVQYYPKVMTKNGLIEDLEFTVQELNELVYEYRKSHNVDIGCTMSLLLIIGTEYYILHVGDSKIYRLRNKFCMLTQDEVILKQVEGKEKTLLMNYVGKSRSLCVNKKSGLVKRGDIYILGSDGLFHKLMPYDMRDLSEQLEKNADVDELCNRLLQQVIERGEKDNISCAILQVTDKMDIYGEHQYV